MENRNGWEMEDIAARVQNVISETLESIKLGQLNQNINDTIGLVLDEAKDKMEQYREKREEERWRRQNLSGDAKLVLKKPLEIKVNWKGKISGILFTIFGSVGIGAFGFLALFFLVVTLVSPNPEGWMLAGLCGIFAVACGGMLWKGISQNGRIGRLKNYIAKLKQRGKTYCEIEELSKSCSKSPKFVKKDLQKIIQLGMLPDAKMDKEKAWLILDEETYRQYQMSMQSQLEKQEEEKQRKKLEKEQKHPKEETTLEKAVREGEEYIEFLDKLRESMPKEPIQEKLQRLDSILERLFETLKKHPEQLDELEKFMEYYLPTTVKLVSTYQEFASVEFPGENIKGAKEEIEQTLDTINGAFEKLLDDMYGDTAFDVITDASVLQTMLAKEGMVKSDFSL